MAGNEDLINKVLADSVPDSVSNLKKLLADLDIQMVANIKTAVELNKVTGNSTSFAEFKKNTEDSTIATQKAIIAQNQAATSAVKLQQAQNQLSAQTARQEAATNKATQAAQKALSPYQQLSKQLDQMRTSAKDVGAQFGENSKQFQDASRPVQELDARLKGIDQTLGQSQRNVGNYGNAIKSVIAQYVPFGAQAVQATDHIREIGAASGETEGALASLGVGFVGFTTVAFIAAIASATYYLSQFKSTANTVSVFTAGIKNEFSAMGETVVNRVKIIKDALKNGDLSHLFDDLRKEAEKDDLSKASDKGKDAQRKLITLGNQNEIEEANNAQLQAEAEKNRALSQDRKLDIADRQAYIKAAQKNEQDILDSQKKNAELTINTAIQVGNKLNTLSKKQIKDLQDAAKLGNLQPAQKLALAGQQFTEEGFELYKQGIAKQIAYQANAANQIVRLQADADNMQLRADRGLAQAQERLDKARVQGALDAARLILDSDTSGYKEKLKANQDFIDNSLKLLAIQKKNQLEAAGVPGRGGADSRTEAVNRAAIEKENQNAVVKVRTEGNNNLIKIQKENNALYDKDNKQRHDRLVAEERDFEDRLTNVQNQKIQDIASFQAEQEMALAKQYAAGKIGRKQYNDELAAIDNKSAQERIDLQINTLKKIIQSEALGVLNGTTDPKKLQSDSNKLSGLQIDSTKLKTKGILGGAQDDLDKKQQDLKEFTDFAQEANKALDITQQAVNSNYENQIALLEKKSKLIGENAQIETDAINRSLDTEANKQRRISILNAQTASQQKSIQDEENKIKVKEAKFDKAIAIAKITEETAVGIVTALTIPVYGEALAIVIGALGAAQLAIAASTPIPTFAKGGTTKGGGLIWGEKGTELAIEPGGKSYLSPDHATFTTMPAGTKIVSHEQLIKPKKMNGVTGGEQVPWRDVIAAIERNKPQQGKRPLVNVFVDTGWANYENRLRR